MAKSIGIDIGGTNFRVGIFEHLTMLSEARVQANFSSLCKNNTPEVAWQSILELITQSVEDSLTQQQDIQHIGIGFPGFIDPKTKILSESPNLPGLKNVNLEKDLSLKLKNKFPTINVVVENDALAAAYGEYSQRDQQVSSMLYFGLGTGVGGGLILLGSPYAGEHGMAMEAGHIIVTPNGRACGCGNLGCVEQYSSASAVALSYADATKASLSNKKYTAHEIASLARSGDQDAISAFVLAGRSLAIAAAHTLKVIDVPTIVIGGGMSQAWDLMQTSFNTTLEENLIPVLRGKTQLIISTLKDKAGMLGAAILAAKAP